jgi:hypothetical protein
MATLVVAVTDATTGAGIPYTLVQVGGLSDSTGLDGTASFDVPLNTVQVVKIRHNAYRPYSASVSVNADPTRVNAALQKVALG